MNIADLFKNVLLCAAIVTFLLGHFLFFIRVSKKPIYRPYRVSRRLLASSYWIMSLDLLIWFIAFKEPCSWPYTIFYDVILYYILCILFSYGFCHLLNHSYISKRRIIRDFFSWIVTSCFAVASWCVADELLGRILSLIADLLLFAYIVIFIVNFRTIYFRNFKILANYYSEDMLRMVNWINKSIFLMVIFSLMSIFVMFQGMIANLVFQIYAIVLNVYIVTTFINYGFKFGEIEKAYQDWRLSQSKMTTNHQEDNCSMADNLIESKLKLWVAAKKYLAVQFTIETVAQEIGTNRNYLSRFINENYHVNFSEWVALLRIAEAKRLMICDKNVRLENIAYQSGFSSASYFSKVFSRLVGCSPAQWRTGISLHSDGV